MEECGYCKERDSKLKSYEEEIEKEKERECQKALEREKIAKGMQCTREDELRLRAMQKMQMLEKKYIEQEDDRVEKMWHQVLVEDVMRKEQKERMDFARRQQEMLERRRAYDEQIASANRMRQEALRQEREKENRRLEIMRKKMEEDYYDELKRKKSQQMANKQNFLEGHEMKIMRLQHEKAREREIDNNTIRVALEELKRDRQRKRAEIQKLQMEKQIFVEYHNRERRMASALEEDANRVTQEWKQEAEQKADEYYRNVEKEKRIDKQNAAQEYRRHLEEVNMKLERERQERAEAMERVKRTAVKELRNQLNSANEELRRQIEYRNSLTSQIRENQRVLENQLYHIETSQRPFTKKAEMFKDAMENKVAKSPSRKSTNPVHPFRRIIEKHEAVTNITHLPLIGKSVNKIHLNN